MATITQNKLEKNGIFKRKLKEILMKGCY